MIADHRSDLVGQQNQRGNIEARLPRDFSLDFALALDHDDAFQPRPIVAFLQPRDIVDHGAGSGFDAPVIAIDRLVPADRRIPETIGFLLGGENFCVFLRRPLIALERDDVIGFFVQDFPFLSKIFLVMLR